MQQIYCITRCEVDSNNNPTKIWREEVTKQVTGKWNKNIVTYALVKGTLDIPDQHEIATGMRLTMQTWQDEIAINLVNVKKDQNPDITFEWVDGNTDPVIKGSNGIMGYSTIPDGTNYKIHIKFNDLLNWSFSGTNFQWNPLNTMLHESGHALGLPHDPNMNAIMYFEYNGKIMLAPSDIAAIVVIYGARTWAIGAYLRMTTAIYLWKRRLK